MKIIKLTMPIETYARSLFKNTVGNDFGKEHQCKFISINPKYTNSDIFIKNRTKKN